MLAIKPYSRTKLCFALWFAGILGIALVIFTVLPEILPKMLQGRELPLPIGIILSLSLLQGAILLAAAVWIGAATSRLVGLRAPVFEAAISSTPLLPHLKHHITPTMGIGLLAGAIIFLANTFGPEAWVQAQASYYPSLATRVLYGGITEELFLRWGFMSLLLWALWRTFQNKQETPSAYLVWVAIALSAFVFALAHLPAVSLELGELSPTVTAFIISINTLVAMLFGILYWRYGLEKAMMAHAVAHTVNYTLGTV